MYTKAIHNHYANNDLQQKMECAHHTHSSEAKHLECTVCGGNWRRDITASKLFIACSECSISAGRRERDIRHVHSELLSKFIEFVIALARHALIQLFAFLRADIGIVLKIVGTTLTLLHVLTYEVKALR